MERVHRMLRRINRWRLVRRHHAEVREPIYYRPF
jgi:hypothetical protein